MPHSQTPLIIFAHANSFPAATYNLMFRSLRARGFAVKAVDKFGHDQRYPVSSNWPHLVQQLADFAAAEIEKHRGPAYLVGHSLGGFLSVMCAAQHPQLGRKGVQGVLLLDAPLLGGWRARTLALIKGVQLVGSVSPGKVSRRRRHQWSSVDDALAHFQHKRAFARWNPQVLRDYVTHCTHDQPSPDGVRRALDFDRDIETAIYNTLPHNLDRLLRRHPLRCPVAFIGGAQSQEMQQVGMAMTHKVVGSHPERLRLVEGSHLFPMEQPQETAALIDEVLTGLWSGQHAAHQKAA